ncbi:MAG: hypothetical protein JWM44_2079 [Bacilli bacterium]|nr:hypothetical protein [Bacilli bacterium]
MSFVRECAELIQRHLRDAVNRELTLEEIFERPYHRRVWAWWEALAFYKLQDHYKRLEDAPDGLSTITIIGKTALMYQWKGKYVFLQEITRKDAEKFYS